MQAKLSFRLLLLCCIAASYSLTACSEEHMGQLQDLAMDAGDAAKKQKYAEINHSYDVHFKKIADVIDKSGVTSQETQDKVREVYKSNEQKTDLSFDSEWLAESLKRQLGPNYIVDYFACAPGDILQHSDNKTAEAVTIEPKNGANALVIMSDGSHQLVGTATPRAAWPQTETLAKAIQAHGVESYEAGQAGLTTFSLAGLKDIPKGHFFKVLETRLGGNYESSKCNWMKQGPQRDKPAYRIQNGNHFMDFLFDSYGRAIDCNAR
jgi:hypothetical protein